MLDGVLAELRARDPQADVDLVERAYATACEAHATQRRKSGEPYLIHPLRVAGTIARLGLGPASVAAGLMHDSVEDSELTVVELTEAFGREVANLVDGVTKLGKVPYLSRREQAAESFRKMLLAMSRDIRVLVVKLADRLDNMRTLEHMPADKRERIARETAEIYVPLARRLGIEWMRSELSDLSFRYLEPVAHQHLSGAVDRLLAETPQFVEHRIERMRDAFAQGSGHEQREPGPWREDVHGHVELRASLRSVADLHEQRARSGAATARPDGADAPKEDLADIAEVVTYQVITRDRAGCYAALGQLHGVFKPIPGHVRDYIALPRPNHYQALHTCVVDRNGVRMDVQIRSAQMDQVAERGIVVDLVGKPGSSADEDAEARRLLWLRQLMDWQDEVVDPHEFIEAVKADLFADEVYVFTPEGDVLTFPKGATPIDFAFSIHTDVGLHCSGARVNGSVVPLRYRLHQGDTVEILTSPDVEPRREWLEMCKTSRAKARIKQYLRQRERERNVGTGRQMVEQHLVRRGSSLERLADVERLEATLEVLGIARDRGLDGVLEEVGAGRVTAEEVARAAHPRTRPASESGLWTSLLRRMSGRPAGRNGTTNLGDHAKVPVVITAERISPGEGSIELAGCCSPVPGDPVIGVHEPNRGIVVHVEDCPRAVDHVEARRVYLAWQSDMKVERPVTLDVYTTNAVGLLAEMSRAFSQHGVDIKQANCRTSSRDRRALNTFHATVSSRDQLDDLTRALRDTRGVVSVRRVYQAE